MSDESRPGWQPIDGGWEKTDSPRGEFLRAYVDDEGDVGTRISYEGTYTDLQAGRWGFGADGLLAAQEWAECAMERLRDLAGEVTP